MRINIGNKKLHVKLFAVFYTQLSDDNYRGGVILITMTCREKTIDDEKKPHQFISMPGINRFGERLKLIMGNESNRSFARKCNLSDSVIGNYVAGKTYPSLDKIEVLAIAGGCSAEWLAVGEEKTAISNINTTREAFTDECEKMWASIFERMTQQEREAVIDKVFRYGITSLLAPYSSGQLVSPDSSAEELEARLLALPNERIQEILSHVAEKLKSLPSQRLDDQKVG
ncbi:helix-turn-helix domain-containing protein [Yersinia wautersii]|uniref:HTH cro/C1-type domain-containing protein n=1 Tax=Yersinia pseudotuberculosis TaxID=633 RepID=A0A380Q3Q6_YERPU|nr:helix-turn-helix domain-containing protein [Yersinia pseudotuberculosis]SUP80381.1 Uncharacterised protein [Yersinia pseudotuberculosis]